MYKLYYIIFIVMACTTSKVSFVDELKKRYDKGIEYFDKAEYTRAKDELQYVVNNNPGSQMALDAQYLLAESHYKLKEYESAAYEFDRYARFAQNYDKIIASRFRICESAINLSNSFQKDQSKTLEAIDRLQEFIEDYPKSSKVNAATEKISLLRLKLAQKEFESARLYLKLEEYDSALIYLNSILTKYYDTEIIDEVRLTIVFLYLLKDETELAISYLENNRKKFISSNMLEQTENLIKKMQDGLGLSEFYRLYR